MDVRCCILTLTLLAPMHFIAASQDALQQCTAPAGAEGEAASPCQAEQPTPADPQLEGLLQVKAVLDADDVLTQWTRQNGRDQGYCSWRGVSCFIDEESSEKQVKQVKALLLSSNAGSSAVVGLKGRLPPASALRLLPGLTTVHISGQPGISGPVPESWASLSQLEDVRMHENQLTGELSDTWSALKNLKVLYLHKNKLNGPLRVAWKDMESLEDVTLNENQFTGTLPAEYASLSKLHSLWVFSNKLEGLLPAAYGSMLELRDLQASYNKFTGELPVEWAGLSKLHILNVGANKLQGTLPPAYSALASLQELQLFENRFNGVLPKEWSALTELQEFNVYDNALFGELPTSYKALTKLKSFTISKNMFSGSVPIQWGKWKALETFVAWGNEELIGCLPSRWEQQLVYLSFEEEVFEGTAITGFCQRKADSPAAKAPPSAVM